MTDDKQEPSAFPNGNLFPGNRGLTMRDAFAMAALQGMMSNGFTANRKAGIFNEQNHALYAMEAYRMADAMMAQREK